MSKNIALEINEADLKRVHGGITVYSDEYNKYAIDGKPLWETVKYVGKKLKKWISSIF